MISKAALCALSIILIFTASVDAQINSLKKDSFVTVVADKSFQKSKIYQFFFGRNRRAEWLTPVRVQVVLLDTLFGGLVPYQKSGGGESKSLRLKSKEGREYVMRSIAKSRRSNALFKSIARDGISMSPPYGAFAVSKMLEAANIYHTKPKLVYIPHQAALDTFNALFANNLYLIEERPAGDWSNAPHLGGYKSYYSSVEVKEKIAENGSYKTNQFAFIKARLFDMLVGDVDRHHGNWKWGLADDSSNTFHPIPVDRDQAFFTYDGLFTSIAIALTRRRLMQPFGHHINNVKKLTLTKRDRSLDKLFCNEMTYNDWMRAATYLQQSLTDSVISVSIQQLPAEIYAISGKELIDKLKLRRDNLKEYASQYYHALSKKVVINGSNNKEYIDVKRNGTNETTVTVYRILKEGQKKEGLRYRRIFKGSETKQITLNGFDENDIFKVDKMNGSVNVIIDRRSNKLQFE